MTSLRVNVQLVSAETGAHLWSDRFDEEIRELAVGQQQIVARMRDSLGFSLDEIESARSLRERPTNPMHSTSSCGHVRWSFTRRNPQRDKEISGVVSSARLRWIHHRSRR